MRGLACHARPDFLAIGAPARANRVDTRQQKQRERARLHERNEAKSEDERRVADVHRADCRLDYRRVLPIERRDVASSARCRRHAGRRARHSRPACRTACSPRQRGSPRRR